MSVSNDDDNHNNTPFSMVSYLLHNIFGLWDKVVLIFFLIGTLAEEEKLDVLKSLIGTQAKVSRTLKVRLQRSKRSKASTG